MKTNISQWLNELKEVVVSNECMVLWCGHASYLIEVGGEAYIYNLCAGMLTQWPDYADKQF
jgi:hypothetical protein